MPFVNVQNSGKSHQIRAQSSRYRRVAVVVMILDWIVWLLLSDLSFEEDDVVSEEVKICCQCELQKNQQRHEHWVLLMVSFNHFDKHG